jgi:hypothetical protein
MRNGGVAMRALFVRRDAAEAAGGPPAAAVLAVSPLLRELILAACSEPLEWDPAGRGRPDRGADPGRDRPRPAAAARGAGAARPAPAPLAAALQADPARP